VKTLTVLEKTFTQHRFLIQHLQCNEMALFLPLSQTHQYKHVIIFTSAYGARLITPPLTLYRSTTNFQSEIHNQM